MDVGILMGCALNGHDSLRGFNFGDNGDNGDRLLLAILVECLGGFMGNLQLLQKQTRNQSNRLRRALIFTGHIVDSAILRL